MTQQTNQSLTLSPVKQLNSISNSLNDAVRIQSLKQVDFISNSSSKHSLQGRVQEDLEVKQVDLQYTVDVLTKSLPVQEKASQDLKALYAFLEAGQTQDAQNTWDAWSDYLQATLQADNTVYTQEFVVQALPNPTDVRQYLTPNYTGQALPNQEQLRQLLGYWHEQEDILNRLLHDNKQALSVANVTLENIAAASPKVNPHALLI